METAASPTPHPPRSPFRGLDRSIERLLGADFRLLYGMAVPILMIVGLIILLALRPSTWLVASVIVLELAALAVVVIGFVGMLNDDEEDSEGS